MKKTLITASLVMASSFVVAADVTFDATSGVASQDLQTAQCGVIATGATAKVRGSKDVRISYACDSSNAGVGAAHSQGKGYAYSASSGGGSVQRSGAGTGFANGAAAQSAAGTAATTAFNSASGSS